MNSDLRLRLKTFSKLDLVNLTPWELADDFLYEHKVFFDYKIYPTPSKELTFEFEFENWNYSIGFLNDNTIEFYGVTKEKKSQITLDDQVYINFETIPELIEHLRIIKLTNVTLSPEETKKFINNLNEPFSPNECLSRAMENAKKIYMSK